MLLLSILGSCLTVIISSLYNNNNNNKYPNIITCALGLSCIFQSAQQYDQHWQHWNMMSSSFLTYRSYVQTYLGITYLS